MGQKNARLIAQLIRHEGSVRAQERLMLYQCPSGKWTLGFGHNIEDRGLTLDEMLFLFRNGITGEDALFLLNNDIDRSVQELINIFRAKRIQSYPGPRFDALVNVCFNIGAESLSEFVRMFRAISSEDWNEAAKELLDSDYARQVGPRANELAEQLRTGEYRDAEKDG